LAGRLSRIRTQNSHFKVRVRPSCGETSPPYVGRVRAMPCLCVLYPGICLTTEEKSMEKNSGYKPGKVSFYPVLPQDCLLSEWLADRVCRSGRTNEYWFMVADV